MSAQATRTGSGTTRTPAPRSAQVTAAGLEHGAAHLAEQGDRLVDARAFGEAGEREAADGGGGLAGVAGVAPVVRAVGVASRVGASRIARRRGFAVALAAFAEGRSARLARLGREPRADTREEAHGS